MKIWQCILWSAFAAAATTTVSVAAVRETVIANFNPNAGTAGAYPGAALYLDASGNLFSTASGGGCAGALHCGTFFELTPPPPGQSSWTFNVDFFFCGNHAPPPGQPCLAGAWPQAAVIRDDAADATHSYYTTAYIGGSNDYGIVMKITPPASGQTVWTGTVIYTFTGGTDGAYPLSALVADLSGALYGTATVGGTYGNGTVFKLTPPAPGQSQWTFTTIWSFGGGLNDGSFPVSGLVLDKNGVLYGTTYSGGGFGSGTVFALTPATTGTPSSAVEHSTRLPTPPCGTALRGPAARACAKSRLSIRSATAGSWTETILWDFYGTTIEGTDGAFPTGTLIVDASGNLFGTTTAGGYLLNDGTVFELSPPTQGRSAWIETLLWSFSGGDGALPYSGLLMDKAGRLYGTTYSGGKASASAFGGTVYRLDPPTSASGSWSETVLHRFAGGATDGAAPYGNVIVDSNGNLFGTTAYGGGSACQSSYGLGCGTVWELSGTGFLP